MLIAGPPDYVAAPNGAGCATTRTAPPSTSSSPTPRQTMPAARGAPAQFSFVPGVAKRQPGAAWSQANKLARLISSAVQLLSGGRVYIIGFHNQNLKNVTKEVFEMTNNNRRHGQRSIRLQIPERQYITLENIAKSEGEALSVIIRRLLREALANQERINLELPNDQTLDLPNSGQAIPRRSAFR